MNFNHTMLYVQDVGKSLEFYTRVFGLSVVELDPDGYYARLCFPQGDATLALHKAPAEASTAPAGHSGNEGIRLYFETGDLDRICEKAAAQGVQFDQMPTNMPWGWRHAYLRDPDGYALSLYWAGEKRLHPSR